MGRSVRLETGIGQDDNKSPTILIVRGYGYMLFSDELRQLWWRQRPRSFKRGTGVRKFVHEDGVATGRQLGVMAEADVFVEIERCIVISVARVEVGHEGGLGVWHVEEGHC